MYNRITLCDISINDAEILRYLGYNGQELAQKLKSDIQRCKKNIMDAAQIRFVCASYELEKAVDAIYLKSTNLRLEGVDIADLLKNSTKCILMAATIGSEVDRTINYHQKKSISDGAIMDAAGAALIERVCDEIEHEIRKIHPITWRYSCGYGDLPINIQPQILSLLNAPKTIGLFCNESNIMIPRKSVTAIMGISEPEATVQKDCSACLYNESCSLRKGGNYCEAQRLCKR